MMPPLTENTKAILLLTAPLIVGRGSLDAKLLTPGEYRRVAQRLHERGNQPADLLGSNAVTIIDDLASAVDTTRVKRLLERGLQLAQAIERWTARAIWVVSRADDAYPRRLKGRLKGGAPAILYGSGQLETLSDGGLAVVGSRNVDDDLFQYAMDVGGLASRAGCAIISGGAKGIDQAAMRGALEAGGRVCGVLADSLERQAMTREHRNMLLDGQLTLVSPFDPNARFHAGNAMQRNKVVYALSDAALVVSSDVNKGGTWTGAVEQLNKHRFVNVYVRATGAPNAGLDALRKKGARDWPNPTTTNDLDAILCAPLSDNSQPILSMFTASRTPSEAEPLIPTEAGVERDDGEPSSIAQDDPRFSDSDGRLKNADLAGQSETPAEKLFAAVQSEIARLTSRPINEAEVAEMLNVTKHQAKAWLARLVEEGVLKKSKKPVGYVACERQLL